MVNYQSVVDDSSGTSAPVHRRKNPGPDGTGGRRTSGNRAVPIALQIVAMIGIGVLVYPSAAHWFTTLGHNAEISGYVKQVDTLPDQTLQAKLQEAEQYNANLPGSVLRDPYAGGELRSDGIDQAYVAYQRTLSSTENGVIGQLSYPRLGISLPIYHGTDAAVLSKGVGHLYGSSLPVGGASTHSVLTSHSGLINAALFTPLLKAKVGDTFEVMVLGQHLYYQVQHIETVTPFITDSLGVIPGEDRVTLMTCTPIGVNSHRLLVHAVRVDGPPAPSGQVIAGDGRTVGFPWWALWFIGASALTAYLLVLRPRRGPRTPPAGKHRAAIDDPEVGMRNQEWQG